MVSVFVTVKKLVSLKKRIVLHLKLLPLISTSLVLKTDSEKRHILPKVNDNIFNFIHCSCCFGTVLNKVIPFIDEIILSTIKLYI